MTKTRIDTLTPYPGNARRGDTNLIAESLQHLGQYKPIIVNKPTRTVLAGNHTLAAAKQLGWTHIDAHYVDVDDDTARRIVLIDNRANDKAGYDLEALVDLVTELPDYTATGYNQDDVDRMLDQLATDTINAADQAEQDIDLDAGNTNVCPMCGK